MGEVQALLSGVAIGYEEVRLWKRELAIVPREDDAYCARSKRGRALWAALTGARA